MSEYKLKMPISLTLPRGSSLLNPAPALPPPSPFPAHAPSAPCAGSSRLLIVVLPGMSLGGCRIGEGERVWTPSVVLGTPSLVMGMLLGGSGCRWCVVEMWLKVL